jgi:peptidyl-prolyl cis-trans isomerase D
LTEHQPDKVESYEDIKGKVDSLYREQVSAEKFYQLGERLAQLSFENPDSLDVVSDELGLKVSHLELFSKTEGTGLAENDNIRHAAFNVDVLAGNNSEPVVVSENHLVVLHVNEHKPAASEPLENVRGAVELLVKQEKAGVILNNKADEIVTALKAGATLEALSTRHQYAIKELGLIKRTSKDAAEEMLREAFSMAHPVDGSLVYKKSPLQNGDVAVIELSDIIDGESSKISVGARGSFKTFLARLKGEVSLAASLANLSVDADVNITPKQEN